jgi:phosphoserine phosphatase
MNLETIIWDFDGTLLPIAPYDSEQALVMHKLRQAGESIPVLLQGIARLLIYADHRERLRKTFKRFYAWFLRGSPLMILDELARGLAAQISEPERRTVRHLKESGHTMVVLSCGTADLSERILRAAGILYCFDAIEGNRFASKDGRITGMTYSLPNPEDKVHKAMDLGIDPNHALAVGDGYTDLPLLDWVKTPVMIDRDGTKQARYRKPAYRFIRSLPEILDIIM